MGILSYGYKGLKTLIKGGKQKTTGTEVIKSVPISKSVKKHGIPYSVAKTRLDESYKRSKQVDKNYKTMTDAKKAFKDAKKDLQKMVDTGRAVKVNKRVHRKGVEYKTDDLYPNLKKKKKVENKKDGGRMGLKFGSGSGKKLSAKQMKIASLAGNKKKIDGPDFAKLRSKKS